MKTAKQTRYVSANQKAKFATSADFYREMSARLGCLCECDGRGCTICIAADALAEAATLCELTTTRQQALTEGR